MPKCWRRRLADEGFRIISGGTDTHLMLIDVFSKGMLGSEAEKALGEAGITVNKNAIPFDTNPPMKPSGIRIGTPALTTRGMKEDEMRQVGRWIAEALHASHGSVCTREDSQAGLTWRRRFRCIPSAGRRPKGNPGLTRAHGIGLASGPEPGPGACPVPSRGPFSVIKSARENRHRYPADDRVRRGHIHAEHRSGPGTAGSPRTSTF